MKRIRSIAAMLVLTGAMMSAPRAEAQTTFAQLGWNSAMTMTCVNAGCTVIDFTLDLQGLQGFENNSATPVPGAVLALGSPGYPSNFSILIGSGPGLFTSAVVTSGGSWSVINFGSSELNVQTALPFVGAPVTVRATLSLGGAYQFSYSGLAYIGANQECYNAAGASVSCTTSGHLYQQGDFNGTVSAVPEPMTMGLMATGLVGLALVGYRRKKNTQV
jgi:hypothetical protein